MVTCRDAAVVIQRAFRTYLSYRYRSTITNWDDCDVITHDPISLIPRKLLCVLTDGTSSHAFHSAALMSWLLLKPIHPITRKPLPNAVIHQCRERIVDFLRSDPVIRKCKRGHYRKKSVCRKALKQYYKRFRCISKKSKHTRFPDDDVVMPDRYAGSMTNPATRPEGPGEGGGVLALVGV